MSTGPIEKSAVGTVLDEIQHVVAGHPEEWGDWREKTRVLREHVLTLYRHREMWRETVEAIRSVADPTTEAAWYVHYIRLYVDSQVIALRRIHVGKRSRRQNVSLVGLLEDLSRHAEVITATRIVELAKLRHAGTASKESLFEWFEREWADGNGRLDPRVPAGDAARLKRRNSRLWALADQTLAHIDMTWKPEDTVTFGELDEAIDDTGRVFQRYWQLLRAGDWIEVQPVLPPSWKVLLSKPVFAPGST